MPMQPATLMIEDPELVETIKQNPLFIYRSEHSYALRNVAARIGVTRTTISQWEDGTAYPTESNMALIAKCMKVDKDELAKQWRAWYEIKHAPERLNDGNKKESSDKKEGQR